MPVEAWAPIAAAAAVVLAAFVTSRLGKSTSDTAAVLGTYKDLTGDIRTDRDEWKARAEKAEKALEAIRDAAQ